MAETLTEKARLNLPIALLIGVFVGVVPGVGTVYRYSFRMDALEEKSRAQDDALKQSAAAQIDLRAQLQTIAISQTNMQVTLNEMKGDVKDLVRGGYRPAGGRGQ